MKPIEPTRKARSDAVLKTLPDDTQAGLAAFLKDHSLKEGIVWLKQTHGVSITQSNLSTWLSWYQAMQRFQSIAASVEAITAAFKASHPGVTDAELFAMGQRIFSEVAIATEDAKTWVGVQNVTLAKTDLDRKAAADKNRSATAAARIEISQRKLALLEAKAAQADAAEKVNGERLSPEEYKRRMREIFGK
jgi:hypothetical protein